MMSVQKNKVITLPNGLEIQLRHEPDAVRVACAVGVRVGSFDEPDAYLGLAHCLEHVLFLGSEGESEGFAQHVQRLGGRYNARTLSRNTQFFADVPAAQAAILCRKMAHLLAKPLFNAEAIKAELPILEAEYRARCTDISQQRLNVLCEQLNPLHPLAKFHAGCLETLAHHPDELVLMLREWHSTHYVARNMRVLITAPLPLDEMAKVASSCFSIIKDKPIQHALKQEINLFNANETGLEICLAQKSSVVNTFWFINYPAKQRAFLLRGLNCLAGRYGVLSTQFDWIEAGENLGFLQATFSPETQLPLNIMWLLNNYNRWLNRLANESKFRPDDKEWEALNQQAAWSDWVLADFERAAKWLSQWENQEEMPTQALLWAPLAAIQHAPTFVLHAPAVSTDFSEKTRWFPVEYQKTALELSTHSTFEYANSFESAQQTVATLPETQLPVATLEFPGLPEYHAASCIYWPNLKASQAEQLEAELIKYWQQLCSEYVVYGVRYLALSRPRQLRFVIISPKCLLPVLVNKLWQHLDNYKPKEDVISGTPTTTFLLRRLLLEPAARWLQWPLSKSEQVHTSSCGERGQHAVLLRIVAPFSDPNQEAAWRVLALHWANPFYQQLRVEQGLGYALFGRFERSEDALELQYGLQSPSASEATIMAAIRDFLQRAAHSAHFFNEEDFHALTVAAKLAVQENGGRQEQFRRACLAHWGPQPLDWDARVIAALQTLTPTQVRGYAKKLLQPDAEQGAWCWLISGQ